MDTHKKIKAARAVGAIINYLSVEESPTPATYGTIIKLILEAGIVSKEDALDIITGHPLNITTIKTELESILAMFQAVPLEDGEYALGEAKVYLPEDGDLRDWALAAKMVQSNAPWAEKFAEGPSLEVLKAAKFVNVLAKEISYGTSAEESNGLTELYN